MSSAASAPGVATTCTSENDAIMVVTPFFRYTSQSSPALASSSIRLVLWWLLLLEWCVLT